MEAEMAAEERIRPLPEVVVSQIESSSIITSLNAVIVGLLQNSLDSGATRVEISVNFGRGNCTVEDDGRGIHPFEFTVDGGLGKMYRQSKCQFGRRKLTLTQCRNI
jgi:DNA mismatch repair protein MLH3